MMEMAIERAEQIAEARQESIVQSVAAEIKSELPRETVVVDGAGVVVTGRGLLKQWLDSANLRFLGSNQE